MQNGTRFVMGCDPGVNGGLALADLRTGFITVTKMPTTLDSMQEFMCSAKGTGQRILFIEKMHYVHVNKRDEDGRITYSSNAHSSGILGQVTGTVMGMAKASGFTVVPVAPKRWMHTVGAYDAGIPSSQKTAWKNNLKAIAQEHFPQIKVTLAIADALLLLLYGYREIVGEPNAELSHFDGKTF